MGAGLGMIGAESKLLDADGLCASAVATESTGSGAESWVGMTGVVSINSPVLEGLEWGEPPPWGREGSRLGPPLARPAIVAGSRAPARRAGRSREGGA